MKLVVFSHKICWKSEQSPSGWATDGGFVYHMQSLASTYEQTVLLVPVRKSGQSKGEVCFTDRSIKMIPLMEPFGSGLLRKLLFPVWFIIHLPKFITHVLSSDVVHSPIPGDVGTIGMLLGPLLRKKVFVRYCGNWMAIKTFPEKCWAWYGETFAGKSIAYLCTGGNNDPPSKKNNALKWIFSTSMLKRELESYPHKKFDFKNEFIICMGARLEKEKGFDILINAVSLLAEKIPQLKVELYGDGPDRQLFEEQVIKCHLSEKVKFLGKLNGNEVHQVLARADIFCFPTYSSEGFPKVVIEAMAHSIPVISTAVSVIPNLINNALTPAGLVVEKQNHEQLAEKIEFYYRNPSIHKIHADNAGRVASVFTLENWVDTINNLLNLQWGTRLCRTKDIIK